ncbi:MAG: hypothetical protein K9K30_13630 [Burkholderiaceae bacterium]|nr:hypothetical protein [Sulfuritalea sp.]MCF8176274.1 hypothetical protein [Burkholderiaceae bacterium]
MKLELAVVCGSWRRGFSQVRRRLGWAIRGPRLGLPILIAMLVAAPPVFTGSVESEVPAVIDPGARYMFYMHGLAIERGGSRARNYDYAGILSELAKRGFVVIGESRSAVKNEAYADKIAGQARALLGAGVPARNITVAGHSKGGMITLLVMANLANPEVAYVNFAGCGREGSGFNGHLRFAERDAASARGKLLSAYDRGDQIAGSCQPALDRMSKATVTERVLDLGGGHELFYAPDAGWLDILQAWAERR